MADSNTAENNFTAVILTNTLQVRQVASDHESANFAVRLKGVVLWVSASQDQFIFQDDSGGIIVKMNLHNRFALQSGDAVLLAGDCQVERGGKISEVLVDNDGIHASIEKTGTTFLAAGWHPITVEWFNNYREFELAVDCMGPEMPRQTIPAAALFRQPTSTGVTNQLVPGLNYSCYEGAWDNVPDFSRLPVVKQGITTNFDLGVRTRDTEVGLVFSGYFKAPRDGDYTFWSKSDDGSKLFIGAPFRLTKLGKQAMPVPENFNSSQFDSKGLELRWVAAEGIVTDVRQVFDGVNIELNFGAGHIYLKVANGDYDALGKLVHSRIKATGIFQNAYDLDGQIAPSILISDPGNIIVTEKDPAPWTSPIVPISKKMDAMSKNLPLLTKAMQVKSLSREEALRGYPVRIQGVITARVDDDFVIQDATWSIFCYGEKLKLNHPPQIGEIWQIEGVSDAVFAPDVVVQNAIFLGPGILPEPIRPTKDELINGSLDTQYIEMQGIITAVGTNGVKLLTREGELEFSGLEGWELNRFKDALIRLNGVCIPDRDTNQMLRPTLLTIRLFNASASMEEPAPTNSFDLPQKHISDLLLFDAHADALRRVKISGQILHENWGEYFITDGNSGARFELREPMVLTTGDLVEVVGFPDVSGSSPVLHEALVRKQGNAKLPEARLLSESDTLNTKLDATLVSMKSRLLAMNKSYSDETLELQIGTRNYLARLAGKDGLLPEISPGSLLQLTGVYIAQGDKLNPENINSFELLLTSPLDVQVLERPSWWTARHALIVIGGMLVLIFLAMIWITLLHRQVEERTSQLASEIKGREQAESQRALEAERTRIAQDLHDELGATLTEIRFLGAVKSRDPSALEDMRSHLKEVSEKSHQMVSSLDEIVWAVNPANDALPNLANYLCHVAEEFFRVSEIRCRLDMDEVLPTLSLSSEVRHSLYLVIREALNNVAKHSHATEAWLRIHYQENTLRIVVEDNGRGFEVMTDGPARNGLNNMRSRLKKIGGEFHYESKLGQGTIYRFELPLTGI